MAEDAGEAMAVMDRIATPTLAGDAAFAEMLALCEGDSGFRAIYAGVMEDNNGDV